MKRIWGALAALVIGATAVIGGIAAPAQAAPQDDVVALVNQQRASKGVAELRRDASLDAAAQEWAQTMRSTGSFQHSTNQWRAERIPGGWRTHGENIAYGYSSAGAVMNGWMNSQGHRDNILRSSYSRIGVGYVAQGNYWVQIFAGYDNDSIAVPGAIGSFWSSIGGHSSEVGSPVAAAVAYSQNGGGWAQEFTRGWIYVSAQTNAAAALRKGSAIFADYSASGSQYGPFGWPRFSERCSGSACVVGFDNGTIGWTAAAGVARVQGTAQQVYQAQGLDRGPLGAPAGVPAAVAGGSTQRFTGGVVYLSPAANTYLRSGSALQQRYAVLGGPSGPLGWPTGEETCAGSSCSISFEKGLLGWTPASGVRQVGATVLPAYRSAGGMSGWLGAPTGNYLQVGDRSAQEFQNGIVYVTPTATSLLRRGSAITQRYIQSGSQNSVFGWPTGSEKCGTATCSTDFEKGTIAWSASAGVHSNQGEFTAAHAESGGALGELGVPISPIASYSGGRAQNYERGYVYHQNGAAAAYALRKNSAIFQRYAQNGSQYGPYGWPTSRENCSTDACEITFERGRISWTASGGVREER